MRFLIDGMFPSQVADRLRAAGHDVVTPAQLGANSLPDDVLIQIASARSMVIVTENASDYSQVTTCAVLLVRKSWWPARQLSSSLANALIRWASAHPDPGPWAHWMEAEIR